MILDAFDTLPAAISKTQRCYELFPDSPMLRDRALTVYLDLLAMIEGMIACLVDKKLCKSSEDSMCALFNPAPSGKNKRRVKGTSIGLRSR